MSDGRQQELGDATREASRQADDTSPLHPRVSMVLRRLQGLLEPALAAPPFWLQGEVGSLRRANNGAVYFDIVEVRRGKVQAKLRCQLWADTRQRLRAALGDEDLDAALQDGAEIGIRARVKLHPVHGLSLEVADINPHVTLGALEARRRKIIERLRGAGLMGENARRSKVPLLPRRVGLVASVDTAGYADFVQTLEASGYGIELLLADARVQGHEVEGSILRALTCLTRLRVDLIVLIRGGGSRLDLAAMDSEGVARRIAQLDIPVWTGIGHEIDQSVLDLVAAQSFKTPTAVAEALVGRYEAQGEWLRTAEARLRTQTSLRLGPLRERLEEHQRRLRLAPGHALATARARAESCGRMLQQRVATLLAERRGDLGQQHALLSSRARGAVKLARLSNDNRQKSLHKTVARLIESARRLCRERHKRLTAAIIPGRLRVEAQQLATHEKSLLKTASRRLEAERQGHLRRREALRPKPLLRRLEGERRTLEAQQSLLRSIDPQRVLERGFALVYGPDGALARGASDLHPGDAAELRFADGKAAVRVESVDKPTDQ